jgi:hypothetical protein
VKTPALFLLLLPLAAMAQDPYLVQSQANQAANQAHIDQMYAQRGYVNPQAPTRRYYAHPYQANPAPINQAPAVAVPAVPGTSTMTYGNMTHIMVPGKRTVTCIQIQNMTHCN